MEKILRNLNIYIEFNVLICIHTYFVCIIYIVMFALSKVLWENSKVQSLNSIDIRATYSNNNACIRSYIGFGGVRKAALWGSLASIDLSTSQPVKKLPAPLCFRMTLLRYLTHVYMSMCFSLCVCACLCVCVYVSVHICVFVCVCVCLCMSVCVLEDFINLTIIFSNYI